MGVIIETENGNVYVGALTDLTDGPDRIRIGVVTVNKPAGPLLPDEAERLGRALISEAEIARRLEREANR